MKLVSRLLSISFLLFISQSAFASGDDQSGNFNLILSLLELSFLGIAVVFSFMTSKALRGGKFGRGMTYLAWGFLVMGIGHLHMQLDHQFDINIFNSFFGEVGGLIAWFVALTVTWGLSGYGFYQIWKVSK
ncbi:MAG: hypothetical protein ABJ004_07920 [Cyclobacteriaceae bacterium]